MVAKEISDSLRQQIVTLYLDPNFEAAYSGLDKFRSALKSLKNIEISRKNLRTILLSIPAYQQFVQRTVKPLYKQFKNIAGAREIFAVDWIIIISDKGENSHLYKIANPDKTEKTDPNLFTGFHLLIDLFTHKIFVIFAKNRQSKYFIQGFQDIFKEGQIPHTLLTDKDQCYRSNAVNKNIYSKFNIFHNQRAGGFYHGIGIMDKIVSMIKLKLARALHANRIEIQNFDIIVRKFVENWNNSENSRTKYPPNLIDNPKYNSVVRKHLIASGFLTSFEDIDERIAESMKVQKIFFKGRPNNNLDQSFFYYQDIVMISKNATYFQTTRPKMQPLRNEQHYIVVDGNFIEKPYYYRLRDSKNKLLTGKFHPQNLLLITENTSVLPSRPISVRRKKTPKRFEDSDT